MKEALSGGPWSIMETSNGSWVADLGGEAVTIGGYREAVLGLIEHLVEHFWRPAAQGLYNPKMGKSEYWISKEDHGAQIREMEAMLKDEESEKERLVAEIDSLTEKNSYMEERLKALDLEAGRLAMRIRKLERKGG